MLQRLRVGKRFAAAVLAVCASLACGLSAASAALCLPPGVGSAGRLAGAAPSTGALNVYLDGSGSMAGYAAGATQDMRPLGDLIATLTQSARTRGVHIQFSAFGKSIRPIGGGPAGVDRYATVSAYRCQGCDNQESHIDAVLRQIADGDRAGVSVVVTDFWLDNRSFAGSPQVALGGPLSEILGQGRTIGVMGVRSPFKGRIYDFPSGGMYADATERPLFVLLIGGSADVAATYAALVQSSSPALSSSLNHYSVFSTHVDGAWVSARALSPVGGGVTRAVSIAPERLPNVQQFALRRDTAALQRGGIEGVFDAGGAMPVGAVWSGPLKASTRVWRLRDEGSLAGCGPQTWTELNSLTGAWLPAGGARARFVLSPATSPLMPGGGIYFVAGYLGVKRLDAPNPADAWMRDWSFNASQEASLRSRRARFFPTLNLADLAGAMESSLARAAPNGIDTVAVGFVVKVYN